MKSATADAFFNQKLQKYGRTSHQTKGRVAGINATVNVNNDTGTARFVGQILVQPGTFIVSGDSGSVAVLQGGPENRKPVGLLYASSSLFAIATPIDVVLDRFGLTVNGE